ncbi:MAG: sulfite exporter TauE/SafE family protein [Solirubrobacterales bacterium]
MELIGAAAIAFAVAAVTTPAGLSGAFLMVPVQLSVLGMAAAAVPPTNLVYNIISIPGALAKFKSDAAIDRALSLRILAGTVPGIVVGVILSRELLHSPTAFLLVVAAVLAPLGLWLALATPPTPRAEGEEDGHDAAIVSVSGGSGVIGGLYGIGGGAIIAPVLVGLGIAVRKVAPATLLATFVTSIVGVVVFELFASSGRGEGVDWGVAGALGIGGLAGSYLGARIQPRVPEAALRRLLGVLALLLSARYVLQAAF